MSKLAKILFATTREECASHLGSIKLGDNALQNPKGLFIFALVILLEMDQFFSTSFPSYLQDVCINFKLFFKGQYILYFDHVLYFSRCFGLLIFFSLQFILDIL